MRFTLRQLTYFVAAGETGSVTLAAERVRISQPSVSAAIAQLEAAFGIQLFVRHHAQGLSLTPGGTRFLAAARSLLQQADRLHDLVDEMTDRVTGPLNVGAFRTYAPLLMPDVCRSFLDRYPLVQLHVSEGDEAALIGMLRRAEISIAVTYAHNIPGDVDFLRLAELPSYVLLPADHPLAGEASIALATLAGEPFILLDMPLTREYFLSFFSRENLAPNIFARSHYPETVRSYVASGFGFSLLTARPRNKSALDGKPLAYVPLKGDYTPMVLGLATLRSLGKDRATAAFEEHCRIRIRDGELPGMAGLA